MLQNAKLGNEHSTESYISHILGDPLSLFLTERELHFYVFETEIRFPPLLIASLFVDKSDSELSFTPWHNLMKIKNVYFLSKKRNFHPQDTFLLIEKQMKNKN